MNGRTGIALVLLLCWLTANAFADNIVQNGSFETLAYCTNDNNGDCNSDPGPGPGEITIAADWFLEPAVSGNGQPGSNFAVGNNATLGLGPAQDGSNTSNYAAFQSQDTPGEPDCLAEPLSTAIDQVYTVTFWLAATGTFGYNTNLHAVWGDNYANNCVAQVNQACQPADLIPSNSLTNSTVEYYFPQGEQGPAYAPAFGWTEFTFTEEALSTSTTLIFHGTDSTGAILLDNVSVTAESAAPEPASFWLISLGLVMTGLFRWFVRKYR